MKKYSAVLIDDEQSALDTLCWKLDSYVPEIEINKCFRFPKEALEYLKTNQPEILFLDIRMPRMNGIELLKNITNRTFPVIFTTAHEEYALEAIKCSAIDYLIKPIRKEELIKSIQNVIGGIQKTDKFKIYEAFFTNLSEKMPSQYKIALSTMESIEFVTPDEIVLCSSDGNYTNVYLVQGRKKLISKTLKEFEEVLSNFKFFRPHKSHLINLLHLKEYIRKDGGMLRLSDGSLVPVSRNRRDELKQIIGRQLW